MNHPVEYHAERNAYVIEGPDGEHGFRIVVPVELIEDEVGRPLDAAGREEWVHAHLPQILQAYTAREGGGFLQEPWGRVLVEEVE
ncbi:MAG: hypothetical protein ACU0AT_01475 [Tranquillimonas sp.]|jgi:hypothetical protein